MMLRLREEERAARQEAEAANRAKDEFVATISHELRTPLTAVLGWAHLLGSGSLGEASRARAVETIVRNAGAQRRLLDDLLDLSRITTGKLHLELRPVDLAQVVDAAVEAARPQAVSKSIRLECVMAPSVGHVMGDPDRLQQVVSNLLANALKFTPGEGRIAVRVDHEGSHVRMQVSDTGKGISPESLPRVFTRFHQIEHTSRRGQDGLGLGLAIVRNLVELHGGRVYAQSPGQGRGATFTVELPKLASDEAREARGPEGAGPDVPEGARILEGLRVLVVDDDADVSEVFRTMLEQHGAEVTLAASETEALAAIERSSPDVLLSELSMLEDFGHAFMRKVTALEAPRGTQLRAVALAADATNEVRARALEAGFHMCLTKSIAPTRLAAAVARLAAAR
jgi:CheY-like chemotaxis protein